MKNKLFRSSDLFVILAVVLLSSLLFLLFLPKGEAKEAVVSYRGKVLERVLLSDLEPFEKTYMTEEGEILVRFERDGVSILSSSCEGQNCVHTSKITKAGEGVLCLPLGFSVLLSGDAAFDGVTG